MQTIKSQRVVGLGWLVGFGRIGKATAALAEAFGMNVIVYKPNRDQKKHPTTVFVELDELFAQSDVLRNCA